MRKLMLLVAVAVIAVFVLSGCAVVATPVGGILFTDAQWPGTATSNVSAAKSASGDCTSILGLVGMGDCSIQTIAHNAHITKIHHVDYHTFSVLGVFGKLTVTVYGD